jgi:hypothetical protein
MKSIRAAAILIALVAAACGAGTVPPSEVPSSRPVATASPTAAPSASPLSPLEGTWATDVITCAEKLVALHEAGFTDAQITESDWSCSEAGREVIRFYAGRLLSFNHDGSVGWDGKYRIVDDETFEAGDNGTYYISYHYVLEGDLLTIRMIEDNRPDEPGPGFWGERIAQTAGYNTAPFTRQD